MYGMYHSAAFAAAKRDPVTLQEALEETQNSVVNLKAFGRGSIVARRANSSRQEDDDEEVNTQVNENKFKDLFTSFMRKYEQAKGERDQEGCSSRREHMGPSSAIRCYRCGGLGHMSRECRKEGRRCFGCREVGHMRADIPAKQSVKSSSRGRGKKGDSN